MGVLYDYFAAASDEEAGALVDRAGGPASQEVVEVPGEEPKRGLFGRKRRPEPTFRTDPNLPVYDTVQDTRIDPIVQLGTLEELLTGRPYDEVIADPRSGYSVAPGDEGEVDVFTITEALTAALAEANDETLERVAVPWSKTEEFWGAADPAELAETLKQLSALASRAREAGQRIYCWASL